jgi:LacI family transcriptional regulator
VDSRDTASAAFDAARPAGDAAGRTGLARASRGGSAPDDGPHAGQTSGPVAGAEQASSPEQADSPAEQASRPEQAGRAEQAEQPGGPAADIADQADGTAAGSAEQAGGPAANGSELAGSLAASGLGGGAGLASRRNGPVPPATIYDVASAAGVSIASVSRVLNGRGNPMAETRERVLAAVADLGFIPDGAARALSVRLKEIIGVVIRRPPPTEPLGDEIFQDEEESLQFPDLINRGIELAAQNRDFNLLVSSVDVDDHDHTRRVFALARKSDGLILHDQVLDPDQLERLSRQVPVVTLAGVATPTTSNVGGDNQGSMRELARHLVQEHGYRTLAYLGGHPDSPDNLARLAAFSDEVAAAGGTFAGGPQWEGNYCAAGGARVIDRLLASGGAEKLPRAIACANDQTALGVVYALMQHGLDVPGDVAVTGFDDIPVARHLRPQLTTVRQPIQELGATAFEVLYSMINDAGYVPRDIVLPTRLVSRESCGCHPDPATPPWLVG